MTDSITDIWDDSCHADDFVDEDDDYQYPASSDADSHVDIDIDDHGDDVADYDDMGIDYRPCCRCTCMNRIDETICQGCETALVANPFPHVDELMANQILQKEHGSMFFQEIENDKWQ